MELLEIYTADGKPTGKTIERGSKNLKDNEYIKLATVWLKSGDKFLIQKSSVEKGGDYAVTGGHVPFGETSLTQACVETQEELGLIVNPDQLKLLGTITLKHAQFDAYIFESDSLIDYNFTLQESEVESLEFLTISQIEDLIEKGVFRKSSIAQFETFIKGKF